jgi:drug/metabolite transporter (DMT)-like permease
VAISVTVNPIASAGFAAYALGEPVTVNLLLGLLLVAAGIWIATSRREAPENAAERGPDRPPEPAR